jgi:hypothetical protein
MSKAPANCDVPDFSPEGAIRREIAKLDEALTAQGLDVHRTRAHPQDGSRDQLYWRYGYFSGLKRALAMLSHGDATLH